MYSCDYGNCIYCKCYLIKRGVFALGKKYYITGIVFLLLIVFILSVIFDIAGIGKGNTPIDVKIADGSGTDGVATSLKAAGAINSKIAFKIYSRLTGEHLYQKGNHSISTSMS